jgi:hypothetical protein
MLNFQTDRAVVLHFPSFAGGKFISNCLSLSRHACPQHASVVNHLINYPTDYQYRFDKVMTTLPPKQDMHNWINKYEFGDRQLYGPSALHWLRGIAEDKTTPAAESLFQSPMHFFLTSHNGPANLLKVWTQAKVIVLTNHWVFSKISKKLKTKASDNKEVVSNYCKEKYEFLAGYKWPTWQEFEAAGFNASQFVLSHSAQVVGEMFEFYPQYHANTMITFDIDGCIFNRHKFLESMEKLYQKLNFDDFNPELVGNFWQAYIALHVDTSQNLQ